MTRDAVVDNILRSQCVEDYLDFFENKDLEGVSSLLASDCTLSDWNVGEVKGKEGVMEIFRTIFAEIGSIEVEISHIHEDLGGTLICEMRLTLDGDELKVADIFEFDDNDSIVALRAYKGN